MEYNFNLPVKVRLTPKGVSTLEKYHYKQLDKLNRPFKQFHLPETDKEGWTKFDSVAGLFEIFGGYSWLCNEPFAMSVKFEE